MSLFLDCEFDGYRGALISIALVSDRGDTGSKEHELYCVLEHEAKDPWVRENVVPILMGKPQPRDVVAHKVRAFLEAHSTEAIYADWADDFMYLCQLLTDPGGIGFDADLDMSLVRRDADYLSVLPHNALADARALMRWYLGDRAAPQGAVVSAGPNPRQAHK